ncbi:hypothetical protein EVAR_21365_1 [Eumeta japonica]|uniref:Uncharacterized protein n=1 Tax=Eumeta variegata TaxID=151549 RepID=A0A4C1YFH6_EUMVA|nr:hypothetical protein EVAR_21365_1 [Eumeta japonica]
MASSTSASVALTTRAPTSSVRPQNGGHIGVDGASVGDVAAQRQVAHVRTLSHYEQMGLHDCRPTSRSAELFTARARARSTRTVLLPRYVNVVKSTGGSGRALRFADAGGRLSTLSVCAPRTSRGAVVTRDIVSRVQGLSEFGRSFEACPRARRYRARGTDVHKVYVLRRLILKS